MSFVFFTSYARVNKTRYLEKFVKELSQQVLDKTKFPPEQIGFFDGSNIETGHDWARVLGDALRTCKVIVCLCTPHSLNSQFCGKEMQVFLLRREHWIQQPGNENRKAGIVFPVIGERPAGALPKALEKFQFTDNALPRKYVKKGLNALSPVLGERDNFRRVVITLAERIRDAVSESDLPEWPQLPPFDKIQSIFHTDASALLYQYGVVFLHHQGRTWCPFGDAPVSTLPDLVAAQTNRLCREIVVGPDLVDRILQSKEKREAIVILTDLATLEAPQHAALFSDLNARFPANAAMFILPNADRVETPEAHTAALQGLTSLLSNVFATSGPNNWLGIRFTKALVIEVVRSLEKLGAAMIRSDPANKIVDDQVRDAARASGVDVDVVPTIGPGRTG